MKMTIIRHSFLKGKGGGEGKSSCKLPTFSPNNIDESFTKIHDREIGTSIRFYDAKNDDSSFLKLSVRKLNLIARRHLRTCSTKKAFREKKIRNFRYI